MRKIAAMMGVASAAMAIVAAPLARVPDYLVSRMTAGRRYNRKSAFDPTINRHTGRPHEHRREIARRLRQQARRG